jgi:dynein light chain Tctex-type 1
MEPPKFEAEAVRAITEQVIQSVLNVLPYDHKHVNKWSSEILETAVHKVCERFPSYKFASQCLILQKEGADFHVLSFCYWDSSIDGMVTIRWENEKMHCIVSIYGFAG